MGMYGKLGYETEVLRAFTFTSQQAPMSPFVKVNLILSLRRLENVQESIREGSEPFFHDNLKEYPLLQTELTLDLTQFHRYDHTFSLVKGKTKDWLISDQARKDMLDKAYTRLQQVVIQGMHNRVTLRIRLTRTLDYMIFRVGRHVKIPACPKAIESLPAVEVRRDEGISCSICLVDFGQHSKEGAALMPCQHVFHRDCITKWLRLSQFCPFCRYEMPSIWT